MKSNAAVLLLRFSFSFLPFLFFVSFSFFLSLSFTLSELLGRLGKTQRTQKNFSKGQQDCFVVEAQKKVPEIDPRRRSLDQ